MKFHTLLDMLLNHIILKRVTSRSKMRTKERGELVMSICYSDKKEYLLEKLKIETMETLTKRGRGVQLEQYCLWIGVSEYGTAKQKAERLINWYQTNKN